MIPALLHQSMLVMPASGVIAAPSYQYVLAHSYGLYSAESEGQFFINPDGSWRSVGTNYPERSGVWRLPVEAGAGDALEVRVTLTKDLTPDYLNRPIVDGSIANEAAAWVPLDEMRRVAVKLQRFTQSVVVSKYIAKVEIRVSAGAVVSTGLFDFGVAVQVDKNGPSSGGGSAGGGDGQIPYLEP